MKILALSQNIKNELDKIKNELNDCISLHVEAFNVERWAKRIASPGQERRCTKGPETSYGRTIVRCRCGNN